MRTVLSTWQLRLPARNRVVGASQLSKGQARACKSGAWKSMGYAVVSLPCALIMPSTLVGVPVRGSVHMEIDHVDRPGSQQEIGQKGHGDEADASNHCNLCIGQCRQNRIVPLRAFDGTHQIERQLGLEGNVPKALQLSLLIEVQ